MSQPPLGFKLKAQQGSAGEFAREDDCQVLLIFDPYGAAGTASDSKLAERQFELAVSLCAAIAWSFHERGALMQYRSAGVEVPLAPATENIFAVLRHLALVQAQAPKVTGNSLLELAADIESFKIIVTSQPHGSIPVEIWNSSYVVFAEELQF